MLEAWKARRDGEERGIAEERAPAHCEVRQVRQRSDGGGESLCRRASVDARSEVRARSSGGGQPETGSFGPGGRGRPGGGGERGGSRGWEANNLLRRWSRIRG